MSNITIALDAMSGDYGMNVVVPAAISILKKNPSLSLILVGPVDQLRSYLFSLDYPESERLRLYPASEIVTMTDLPAQALRYKKDSSMRVAINLVKEGVAQACVSAGNTGALVATAHFVLKTLPGIDRPAIIRSIPSKNKAQSVRVLDLGANVDCSAEQLSQFALMGSVLTSAVDKVEHPKVALLNIGEEAIKGNIQVKEAAALLAANPAINYIGFIEGDKIFSEEVDVIVCDGFVGNAVLKAMEGLAKFVGASIKAAINKNWMTRILCLGAFFVLRNLKTTMDPSSYNGASLVGLKGIVIKSHGSAQAKSFEKAIEKAVMEVEGHVVEQLSERLAQMIQ